MAGDLSDDLDKISQEELHKRLGQLMLLDRDEKYFTSLLFTRTFEEVRKCKHCGFHGIMKKPPRSYERNSYGSGLELYLLDRGVVGKHQVQCPLCSKIEGIWSYDKELPPESHKIFGLEVRYFVRRVGPGSLVADAINLMMVEDLEDPVRKKKKLEEAADFMLKNARRVSEEWCSPDNAEARHGKLFWLYDQCMFSIDNKGIYPSHLQLGEEHREIYDNTLECFLHNFEKTESLLRLLKETLFDHPTRPVFMVWLCIAMTQVDLFSALVKYYDPKIFMDSDDNDFQSVREQYKMLNMPREIKKIPIVLMLFEMPRFFHYTDFAHVRAEKKSFPIPDSDVDRMISSCLSKEGLKMAMGGTQGKKIFKSTLQQSRAAKKNLLGSLTLSCLDYLEHCDDFEKEFVLKFHKLSMADQYRVCWRSLRVSEHFSSMQFDSDLPTPIMFKHLLLHAFKSEGVVDDDLVPFKDQPKIHRDMKETLEMLTKKSQSAILDTQAEEMLELSDMVSNAKRRETVKPDSSSESSDDDAAPFRTTLPLDEIMDRVRDTLAERNISIPERYMPKAITLPSNLVSPGSNGGNMQALMVPVPPPGSKDAEELAESMEKSRPFLHKNVPSDWGTRTRNVYTIHVPTAGARNEDGTLQVTPKMYYHGRETLSATLKNLGSHAHVTQLAANPPTSRTVVRTSKSVASKAVIRKLDTKNCVTTEEQNVYEEDEKGVITEKTNETECVATAKEDEKRYVVRRKGKIPRHCGYCKSSPEKLLTCKACRSVAYCSSSCQRAHWKVHKRDCRELQDTS